MRFDGASHWYKFTKPNGAGFAIEVVDEVVIMLPATPLQYLDRWRAHNAIFDDDVELVGVSKYTPGGLSLVVFQRDVQGEGPSWDDMENMFVDGLGLRRLRVPETLGGYESRAYFSGRIGVFDVRPVNCVQTGSGLVVPIDVIPQFFNRREATTLKRLTV